jgi:hypothetical protein
VSAKLTGENGASVDVLMNDCDDGSYEAKYTATSSGAYLLGVFLGGEHVHGSPFPVQILPAPAQAHSCFVASMPTTVIAGSRAALAIHLTDGFGNRQPNDAPLLTAKALRATVEPILDHGDGSVAVQLVSECAGELELEVLLGTKPIRGSPYRLHVAAADIDPTMCQLTPFEFDSCESGVVATASLKCADKFGNTRAADMGTVHAEIRACEAAAATVLLPVDIDTADALGTYSVRFVAQHCASYAVRVKVSSHDIFAGTVTVPIASSVHIPSCIVLPPLTQHVVAGQLLSFTIQLMDPLGHRVVVGGQTRFEVDATGPSQVKGTIVDRLDGSCEGSLKVCTAGLHFVRIHSDGQTISAGLTRLLVEAAAPSAPHSELCTASLADASIGTVSSVFVQLNDAFGNPAHDAGRRLTACLVQKTRVECEVQRVGSADGKYVVVVRPPQPGSCTLEVMLDSVALRGCPFSFTVATAELDPKRSSISIVSAGSAAGTAPLSAGQELSFLIEGRDNLGQPRSAVGLGALACTLVCVDSQALTCVPQLCGDRMVFTPTHSGEYTLSASLDGVAVGTGVQSFSVVAAGRLLPSSLCVPMQLLQLPQRFILADPRAMGVPGPSVHHCTASMLEGKVMVHSALNVDLVLCDRFNNPIVDGSALVTAELISTSGAKSIGHAHELGMGLYRVTILPAEGGSSTLSLFIAGDCAAGFPREISVEAGAARLSDASARPSVIYVMHAYLCRHHLRENIRVDGAGYANWSYGRGGSQVDNSGTRCVGLSPVIWRRCVHCIVAER